MKYALPNMQDHPWHILANSGPKINRYELAEMGSSPTVELSGTFSTNGLTCLVSGPKTALVVLYFL